MDFASSNKATLIGIPLDLGAENLGVDVGPDAFRYQKIIDKLESAGLQITDAGNIGCKERGQLEVGNPKLKYLDEIVRVCNEAAQLSEAAIAEGKRVIALGGDHSICLGVVSGASVALGGELGLIYLDAHGDSNTPEITLSGNIHGMHLASLLGYGAPELAHVHGDSVKIAKNNLLHIGGSDIDPAEWDFMQREGFPTFTMFDLLSKNLGSLLGMIDDLASRVRNIWVSLDLDVIDSVYAPGAGIPNQGGLTYREIAALTDYIGQHCNVVGVDVVEYNPLQDVNRKTAELGIELIAKLLGTNYSWYTTYMSHNQVNP